MTSMTFSPQAFPHFGRLLEANTKETGETRKDLKESLDLYLRTEKSSLSPEKYEFFKKVDFTNEKQLQAPHIAKYEDKVFLSFFPALNGLINKVIHLFESYEDRITLHQKFKNAFSPQFDKPMVTVRAWKHTNQSDAQDTVKANNQLITAWPTWRYSVVDMGRKLLQDTLQWNEVPVTAAYHQESVLTIPSKKSPDTTYLITAHKIDRG
ncbi:MAG: hypothetical protein QE263_07320 [Vampirovibrionales bacterium]|nr:hypothetical protein [Vampirovibrionales bacterium]